LNIENAFDTKWHADLLTETTQIIFFGLHNQTYQLIPFQQKIQCYKWKRNFHATRNKSRDA